MRFSWNLSTTFRLGHGFNSYVNVYQRVSLEKSWEIIREHIFFHCFNWSKLRFFWEFFFWVCRRFTVDMPLNDTKTSSIFRRGSASQQDATSSKWVKLIQQNNMRRICLVPLWVTSFLCHWYSLMWKENIFEVRLSSVSALKKVNKIES